MHTTSRSRCLGLIEGHLRYHLPLGGKLRVGADGLDGHFDLRARGGGSATRMKIPSGFRCVPMAVTEWPPCRESTSCIRTESSCVKRRQRRFFLSIFSATKRSVVRLAGAVKNP